MGEVSVGESTGEAAQPYNQEAVEYGLNGINEKLVEALHYIDTISKYKSEGRVEFELTNEMGKILEKMASQSRRLEDRIDVFVSEIS